MPSSEGDPVESVIRRVRRALEQARLASNRRRIVVAVSGGVDSLCLLDAAVAVRSVDRPNLIVGHVDHQLRPDSAADAAHVADAAGRLGIRCQVKAVDVAAIARESGRGIEETARIARYRALSRIAKEVGASAILTGHTRSDSVETVLLHLLRGSGPRGLRGIEADETLDPALICHRGEAGEVTYLRVVRPLLEVDRDETVAYCAARSIAWRLDPTNADPHFARNRVRRHLLPVLRTYNPAVDASLDRLSHAVRDDERWIDRLVERAFRQLARRESNVVTFDVAAWTRQPLAVRRRLVLRVADQYRVGDVGFEAVERALRVAEADGPPRAELGGGLVVERTGGALTFQINEGR